MTRRKANAEPSASMAEHRTPEYQQERAKELIDQAGVESRRTAERAAAIDWSTAPESATHYIARHGPSVVCAWWLSGADTMDEAPVFFDLEAGQTERISRASCLQGRAPLSGIAESRPLMHSRPLSEIIDDRHGANPVAANVNGYRKLTDKELELINEIKAKEREVGELWRSLHSVEKDPRWYALARTDIERGFMALVRSIARPTDAF